MLPLYKHGRTLSDVLQTLVLRYMFKHVQRDIQMRIQMGIAADGEKL